jgi:DNA-binding SARP family transcriptional activator
VLDPARPLRLQLFGAPSIRATDGREATAALAQPKRMALLAYLAAAAPYGFHRRDTLLALFWPEADAHHARTALRTAVHFLRRELGSGVIANRGDEELGIDEAWLWCDVPEFDRELASDHVTEALALYRGDLLPGFFVPDAPGFERWLDEERLRLRGRAGDAAWTLAGRLERDRDVDGAASWARWAAALTPEDERAARRLIALLGRLGDRAGAIRVHDELAALFRREYDVAPSTETTQLVDAVRRSTAPAAGPGTPITRQYIAVLPFPVHGDGSAAYLREGLVDMLSTNLDHAGTLRCVDPHTLLSRLGREGERRLDLVRAAEVAAQLGAQVYVSGSVVGVAGHLRISATLHYQSLSPVSARFLTVTGPAERLVDLVDELTSKLLAELHPGPAARLTRLAATTTDSLPALKAYLAGERALRKGRHGEAIEAFEQAVAHDPEFALAWYRLAFFLAWPTRPQPHTPSASMERALEHKQRLSDRERQLLEALSASLDGRADEAERIYREILAVHAEDMEAWLGLGRTLLFHNPQRGRLSESRVAFERVLELDPGNEIANLFLSQVANLERNAGE